MLLIWETGWAQEAVLRGTVRDSVTNEPLPHANVLLEDTNRGTATDDGGRYIIRRLSPGRYTVVFSFAGYEPVRRRVELSSGEERRLDVRLSPGAMHVGEVIVRGEDSTDAGLEFSTVRLETSAIQEMPAVLEADVFRSLQQLSGVTASSDYSSALYIRGSGPSHTLVEFSGAPIYNPSHLLGFFSTFNSSAIGDTHLYKGAYPVSYGGRLGSVVDIGTADGNRERLTSTVDAGLLASRAAVEGPHPGGSWMIALRRSTMEPVLAQLNARDIEGVPEAFAFYDINGHLTADLSSRDKLSLTLFRGRDDMHFPFNQNLLFDVAYGNSAGTIDWQRIFGSSLITHVSASASRYGSSSEALLTRAPYSRTNEIIDLSLEGTVEYMPDAPYQLSAGIDGTHYYFSVHDIHGGMTRLQRSARPWQGSFYVSGSVDLNARWTAAGGVRIDHFSAGSHRRLSGRAALNFHPVSSVRLRVAGGRYHQFLTRHSSQLLSSFDAWLPAADRLPPSYADHLTGGVRVELTDELSVSAEGYLRRMQDLFRLDPRRPDAAGIPYHELFLSGEGYAYGLETRLQQTSGVVTGAVGYTYGSTRRRFPTLNDGQFFAPRHDRPHLLNAVLHLDISAGWRASALFTYASGQPLTRPSAQYILPDSPYMGHNHAVLISPFNESRLPAYHRLDLGVSRRGELFQGVDYGIKFQVVNVLSRDNIWFDLYEFNEDYEIVRTRMPQIPVALPNLSFGLEF